MSGSHPQRLNEVQLHYANSGEYYDSPCNVKQFAGWDYKKVAENMTNLFKKLRFRLVIRSET